MSKNNTNKSTVYIQIAAYRDPELLNTIHNCLETAEYPENLRFSIAWQRSPYDEWDTLEQYKNDTRFRILDIDYRDAKGPCWARHKLNKMYNDERYTLQIDSHHRFSKHWDSVLINMLESLRSNACPKPVLSTYLPSFDPKQNTFTATPWIMEFQRFAPEGPVHFLPHNINDWEKLTSPISARFISGHFIFADGRFCREVEYDPTYYFHGEEINLSVRAYMAGYDVFAPHIPIIWHEYTRNDKKKHWDDHVNWTSLENASHAHNKEVFGIDNIVTSKLLTKNARTLREYEMYAGLEFKTRRVHVDTLSRKLPPISLREEEFVNGLVNYHNLCIDVYRPSFTENDYNVWAIAFEDKNGNEIYRGDASAQEIKQLLSVPESVDKFVHIWRNFHSDTIPVKWIVWPHSQSKGWTERLVGTFRV